MEKRPPTRPLFEKNHEKGRPGSAAFVTSFLQHTLQPSPSPTRFFNQDIFCIFPPKDFLLLVFRNARNSAGKTGAERRTKNTRQRCRIQRTQHRPKHHNQQRTTSTPWFRRSRGPDPFSASTSPSYPWWCRGLFTLRSGNRDPSMSI